MCQLVYFFTFPDAAVIKVDFAYFPFPHLGEHTKYKKIRIASILDIAVNKLQALMTRKRSRDYVDLFFCLRYLKTSITDLALQYRLKFDTHISLEQLATLCTNVLDAADQSRFLGDTPWGQVQSFFLDEAKCVGKQTIR